MNTRQSRSVFYTALVVPLLLAGGAGTAQIAPPSEYGPAPELPPPEKSWIPTLRIPKNVGWPEGATPIAATGLRVTALARGLSHPRSLYVLPNGDVLVAETDAPPDPASKFADTLQRFVLWMSGAPEKPSPNRITLLRMNSSGALAERHVFLQGLKSPFGMALIGHTLYVANNGSLLRFPYRDGDTELHDAGLQVTTLPSVPGHWTRNLLASPDGTKLYVGVGSSSNVGDNGLAMEAGRAAIWEVDVASGQHRIFASGLRNPVGLAWEPQTGALWASVNERDELGDHLPPDYMTSVRDGGFYGFPFSYYGQHVDTRFQPQDPAMVAKAIVPDYALGAHTASLGLCWSGSASLPAAFQQGMFVGQHGSWNRATRSGYKVIFVAFEGGRPKGMPVEVLTGFLSEQQQARGRPVGVTIDSHGALLVADDVGDTVWRVTATPSAH